MVRGALPVQRAPVGELDRLLQAAAVIAVPAGSRRWCARVGDGLIDVVVDRSVDQVLAAAGPAARALRMSAGAAAFTARTVVSAAGWRPQLTLLPDRGDPLVLARVLVLGRRTAPATDEALAAVLPVRTVAGHAARPAGQADVIGGGDWETDPWLAAVGSALSDAARAEGTWLDLPPRDRGWRVEPPLPGETVPDRGGAPLLAVLGTLSDWPVDQIRAGVGLQRILLTAAQRGLAGTVLPVTLPRGGHPGRRAVHRPGCPQAVLRFDPGPDARPSAGSG